MFKVVKAVGDWLQRWQAGYAVLRYVAPWLVPSGTAGVSTYLVMLEHARLWLVFLVAIYGFAGGLLVVFAARKTGLTSRPRSVSATLTPIRILERFYLALASLRDHVEHLQTLEKLGGTSSASAFIDVGLVLRKIRTQLVNMSPEIFTTSEAMDFRETGFTDPHALSEVTVPYEIEHLMKTIHSHWSRHGERVAITPLRFKGSPIVVKVQDE